MPLTQWLLLAAAGGAGAGLRALAVLWFTDRRGAPMWKTLLVVNLVGSALAGVLVSRLVSGVEPATVEIALTGFLGGFTTFSGFAVECVELWRRGERSLSARFAGLSVALSAIVAHLAYLLSGGSA